MSEEFHRANCRCATAEESVLDRVKRITTERQASYGPPNEHWARTVDMVNALYGTSFVPEDWGKLMILDKLARDAGTAQTPDNLDDLVGYAACIERVRLVARDT